MLVLDVHTDVHADVVLNHTDVRTGVVLYIHVCTDVHADVVLILASTEKLAELVVCDTASVRCAGDGHLGSGSKHVCDRSWIWCVDFVIPIRVRNRCVDCVIPFPLQVV